MKRCGTIVMGIAIGVPLILRPGTAATAPRHDTVVPVISYTLRLDTAHLDAADVTIRLQGMPQRIELAMKVHAEYDARYWRFVDGFWVDGTDDDARAGVEREDSTLWRVTFPGGHGAVHYRVHIQPPPTGVRRAWLPYVRADGALINSPDFFLYAVDFANTPVTLALELPASWRVATALSTSANDRQRSAPDATTLLDSPIMLGALRSWSYDEGGTTWRVAYWPLPTAVSFDTTAFVDELRRVTRVAVDLFGRAPSRAYLFLIEDGASDALEHGASMTIGVPSERLAVDPRASLLEITHEFFHTWNLVAVRPAHYNDLSYRPPRRTPLLWLGEGVTLYYADVLPRRAGLAVATPTRLEHLASLLERYYGSPAILLVSPERASSAFGDSYIDNTDATGGYYLQGELLGAALDARLRDATHDRRGLDDLMRALFEQHNVPGDSGVSSHQVEDAAAAVCRCDVSGFFAKEVRGSGPIDVGPLLRRLGLVALVDSVPAADGTGRPAADTRIGVNFASIPSRVVITNPASAWATAGLRTGDELVALHGESVRTFNELSGLLRRMKVGDTVAVDIRRLGQPLRITVPLSGYLRPRVRFVDEVEVSPDQLAHRRAWLAGR